jgi:hypothetical protein
MSPPVIHLQANAALRDAEFGNATLAKQGVTAALALSTGRDVKVLGHTGIVQNFVTGSLAHLQIGLARAMSGDAVKAKSAYLGFLTLWKDADPVIPILKEARTEYAKLQ